MVLTTSVTEFMTPKFVMPIGLAAIRHGLRRWEELDVQPKKAGLELTQ